jgi:hypothetical protein
LVLGKLWPGLGEARIQVEAVLLLSGKDRVGKIMKLFPVHGGSSAIGLLGKAAASPMGQGKKMP